MANDTREDHGSYYPGAKVIVSGSGTSGTSTDVSGKVDRVTIGEIGDTYTLKTVKEKVDKLIKAVAPVASCLTAMLYVSTAMAATEVFEDIPSNARVVVSEDDPVALAAIPEAVGAATNAAVETAKKYADAAVAVEASNREDAVEGVLVRSKSYTDAATNALAAKIPVVDLAPYATKSWVETKGYVTSDALGGVATKEWVSDQGYLTLLAMAPYATMDWVMGKDYATASVTNGLAAKTWVEQKGYLASESAKRTYATKDELDALKRRYADTNGVTRIWSEDGLTMTDGTGVVWDVTWNMVTNWVSLTNGISYTMNGAANWIGDGIVTNADGEIGVGRICVFSEVPGMYNFGLNGFDSYDVTSPDGLLLSFDGVNMRPDAFTGVVERVKAFSFRSRVVTNAVGYVVSGTITDGTNTITAAGDVTAAGIGKGYWMVRRIPNGAWRKLVPVPESDTALWRDVDTNSYVGDYSGAPDGMWTGSVDGFSNTFYIPAERYEAFSDSNAEGYYVPDRKTLATVDQIPTTPEQIGAYTKAEVDAKVENSVLPTNPTFSNAVLSVGLNIDTNSVAVLNEIAETFGGFPIGGTATTVGGLLAALAAAIAWLKKNKADKTELRYALGSPLTESGTLADRTINLVQVGAIDIDLALPEAMNDGTARDLLVRIEMASDATGTPSIALPESWDGDTIPAFAAGKNYLLTITETKAADGTNPSAWYVRVIELTMVSPST